MKEILFRVASNGISRAPVTAIRLFLRWWLLGSMAVSAALCINSGRIPITQYDFVVLLGGFAIGIVLAAIPVLIILIMWWILFG